MYDWVDTRFNDKKSTKHSQNIPKTLENTHTLAHSQLFFNVSIIIVNKTVMDMITYM